MRVVLQEQADGPAYSGLAELFFLGESEAGNHPHREEVLELLLSQSNWDLFDTTLRPWRAWPQP
jgi:hypothetical protein